MTDGRDEKCGARKRPQDRLRESAKISPWLFWEPLTVEKLARLQNVNLIQDISLLFGTWPGEPDDGFEEAIKELRRGGVHKDGKSRRKI